MTKKNAMREVMDMIAKKEAQIKKIRHETTDRTYQQYILKFLEELEEAYLVNMSDELEFWRTLNSVSDKLLGRLQTFDPGVNAEVIWNSPEHWKDLRAVGVTIRWSKEYRAINKNVDEEEFVDVTELMFSQY
jgi:hypothetical protein